MEFPVDDVALENIKHALNGSFTVGEDGTHHLVGADFSLNQLLDFYSGYDKNKLVKMEDVQMFGSDEVYEYPDPVFHYTDVIRALIAEIERLRNEQV